MIISASVEAKSRRLSLFVFASLEIHRAESRDKMPRHSPATFYAVFSGLVNLKMKGFTVPQELFHMSIWF